jgi:hypothetical protein
MTVESISAAAIGGGGGGSLGYSVYAVSLSGGVEENPDVQEFSNQIGAGTWTRFGNGDYRCLTTTPFDVTKIFISNMVCRVDTSSPGEEAISSSMMPVLNFANSSQRGFYRAFAVNNGGFLELQFDTFDADGINADLGLFDPPTTIYFPEIRVYP